MDKKEFIIKLPDKKSASDLKTNGIFVFDSCSLLSVYSLANEERKGFFSILKKLSDQNRIWLPYQFFEEFEIHRLKEIQKQYDAYNKFKNIIDEQFKAIYSDKNILNFDSHEFLKKYKNKYLKRIKNIHNETLDELSNMKAHHPDWRIKDPIKKALMTCFENKIGDPYLEEDARYQEIVSKGAERYARFIPPGYMDMEKNKTDATKKKQFGDLIGWYQILDFSKIHNKPIVIVTIDEKEDWWNKHGGKLFGPRIELMYEIYEYAGVHLSMFNMEGFLKYAKEELDFSIHDNLIEKVKEIADENLNEESMVSQDGSMSQEPKLEQSVPEVADIKEAETSS